MKYFKIVPILLFIANFTLHGNEPSVIGDYHIGFGYQHYSGDGYDANTVGLLSNFAVHPNFDLSTDLAYSQLSVGNMDLSRFGVNTGFKIHNKFELDQGSSIDPYFGLSLGLLYAEQLYYYNTFNYYYYTTSYYTDYSLLVPYDIHIGTEFKIASFISLMPYLGLGGVLNDSSIDSFGYFGLMTNFFIGDFLSLGLNLRGDSEDGLAFLLGMRFHL